MSAGGGVSIVTGLGFFPVLRAAVDGDERFAPSSTRTLRWIALTRPDGKQKLRDDIKARINKAFERAAPEAKDRQEVLSVYFSDFIIQ